MPQPIIRDSLDSAGGGIIGTPQQTFCLIDGVPIAMLNEKVADHGTHINVKMGQSSIVVKINNIGICRAGDQASCGDYAVGGSNFCFSD